MKATVVAETLERLFSLQVDKFLNNVMSTDKRNIHKQLKLFSFRNWFLGQR